MVFRFKWPARLAPYRFSGELIRSLKTSDFHIVRRRALMLVVKIETMTSSVDIPKQAEVESAIRGWIDDCVWRREIKRAETGGLDFFENLEIEKMVARKPANSMAYASNLFAPQDGRRYLIRVRQRYEGLR